MTNLYSRILNSISFRVATIFIIILLFGLGSLPTIGENFPGAKHYIAHFSVYSLLAISFGLGWKSINGTQVWLIISLIGIIQEMTEIVTHHHPFELTDAVLDSFSVLLGVMVLIWLRRRLGRTGSSSYG